MIGEALDLVVGGRDPLAVEKLSTLLGRSTRVAVVGTASDPESLLRMCDRRHPRIVVIAVDSELACRLLTQVREGIVLPIIAVCSSDTLGMSALLAGALEWVESSASVEKIVESVHLMAGIRIVRKQKRRPDPSSAPKPETSSPSPSTFPTRQPGGRRRRSPTAKGLGLPQVVAIGGSTGAPVAILELLAQLARPLPAPLIIAQHMPHDYSEAFAHWLATSTEREVKLVLAGQPLERGLVHVAPANQHTTLHSDGTFRLERARGKGASPSIDRLFHSLTALTGFQRYAILLTGMGRDGADGLLALRTSGARTLAQDERSSAVFGMPSAAAQLGAAEALLPPPELGLTLAEWLLPPLLDD